jgi:hypothetical protein
MLKKDQKVKEQGDDEPSGGDILSARPDDEPAKVIEYETIQKK